MNKLSAKIDLFESAAGAASDAAKAVRDAATGAGPKAAPKPKPAPKPGAKPEPNAKKPDADAPKSKAKPTADDVKAKNEDALNKTRLAREHAEMAAKIKMANESADVLAANLSKVMQENDNLRKILTDSDMGKNLPPQYRNKDRDWFFNKLKESRAQIKRLREQIAELKKLEVNDPNLQKKLALTERKLAEVDAKNVGLTADLAKATDDLKDSQKVVSKLSKELDDISSQNADFAKVVDELKAKNGTLTAENERLLKELSDASRSSGKTKATKEAIHEAGGAKTPESDIVNEAEVNAGKRKQKAVKDVVDEGVDPHAARLAADKEELEEKRRVYQKLKYDQDINKLRGNTLIKRLLSESATSIAKYITFGNIYNMLMTGGIVAGLGIGAYLAYLYFSTGNEFQQKTLSLKNSILKLKESNTDMTLKPGSTTSGVVRGLDRVIDNALITIATIENLDKNNPQDINLDAFDELERFLDTFIANKDVISMQAISTDQFAKNLANVYDVKKELGEYKSIIANGIDAFKNSQDKLAKSQVSSTVTEDRLGESPVNEPTVAPGERYIVNAYGLDLDISHWEPALKSAAPRIIKNVLNSPVGKAFVDPDNLWGGGFLQNTGDMSNNIKEDIRFLALNRLDTPSKLYRFLKNRMPKSSTKRHSGLKNAIKEYKGKNINLSNKKEANNCVNLKKSTTVHESGMQKTAEQFSDVYMNDLIKSVSDNYSEQYWKSYKDLYNEKRKDYPDSGSLYNVSDNKGPEAIAERHPKSVYMAESMNDGGLIENSLEQHKKTYDILFSKPTGNFTARYAWLVDSLIKVANKADEDGNYDVSNMIDNTLNKLDKII